MSQRSSTPLQMAKATVHDARIEHFDAPSRFAHGGQRPISAVEMCTDDKGDTMSIDAAKGAPPQSGSGSPLFRNTIFLLIGQIVSTALAIVTNGALGRALGPSDYGLLYVILSFVTIANVSIEWGQNYYSIREVARFPMKDGRLVGAGLVLRTGATIVGSLPIALAAWTFGYDRRMVTFTTVYLILNLPLSLAQFYGIIFRGRDRMEFDSIVSIVNKLVAFGFILTALRMHLGLGGVIGAQGVAGFCAVIVAAAIFRRIANTPITIEVAAMRETFHGGTPFAFMNVAMYAQPYIDAVLLSKFAPPTVVGWYGAARTIQGTLYAPPSILASAAFPGLSRVASNLPEFARELRRAMRIMLWLGALTAVGTFQFADVAIHIVYGKRQYSPAADVLSVYGMGLFIIFIDMLLSTAMAALNRSAALSIVKICSVVASTILDIIFIPYCQRRFGNGGLGTVVAFILSELVMFGGVLYLLPRGILSRGTLLDGARVLGAGFVTLAVLRLIPHLVPWLAIPLCIFLFTAVCCLFGLFGRSDFDRLRLAIRKVLGINVGAVS